jgi:hypothetical protein
VRLARRKRKERSACGGGSTGRKSFRLLVNSTRMSVSILGTRLVRIVPGASREIEPPRPWRSFATRAILIILLTRRFVLVLESGHAE